MKRKDARKRRKKELHIINQKKSNEPMETSEKSSKRNLALTAQAKEMEIRFKKQCDACTEKHKKQLEFREEKHAKEFAELVAQRENDRNYYDRETEKYRRQLSTNWQRSKFYQKYMLVIVCLCVAIAGIGVQSVYHVKHYRKMDVYNDALKYIHDRNPNVGIKQVIRIFERPEIDPERHKFMNEKIENYESLWWLKE
jgi:hypothetical protein